MKESLYKNIIDQLNEINFTGVIYPHFYGEPLLDKRLLRLMSYTRKKLPYCYIEIHTNGDHLTVKLFKKLISLGANEFQVTRHGAGLTKDLRDLLKDPLSREKITYQIYPFSFSNRGDLVKVKQTKKVKKCLRPSKNVVIDYQGNMILCCNDYFSTVKFGNLTKSHIIDIWRKRKYKRIRREIKKGAFSLAICKKCTMPF